jgi:hypothetical protein
MLKLNKHILYISIRLPDLSHNDIDDKGLDAIAEALQTNNTLTTLCILFISNQG